MTGRYFTISDVAKNVVDIMRRNHADVDAFRSDVVEAALSTGREISSVLDEAATRQLKSALQFLFALADAADQAPNAEDGNANPDAEEGFLT